MIKKDLQNYIIDSDEIIGDIQYLHEYYSIHLKNERDIIIWLPPSYHLSAKSYPVLYMQDGQNLFDPNTSFIGNDWKVDEVASGLIRERLIEEIIIVGIYNNKDRIEEYNYFSKKGKMYASFMIKELKPFIDENYRTIPKSSESAIMGSSMGGLVSFQLFWNFPKIFGKAACLSNSFWIDDGEVFNMVNKVENTLNEKNRLYVDCGTEEIELIDDYNKMVEIIKSFENKKGYKFANYLIEGSTHTETDWANRLHVPLRFLFGKTNKIMP